MDPVRRIVGPGTSAPYAPPSHHRGLQTDDNQEFGRVGPTTIGPQRPRHVENRPVSVRPLRSLVITKYYVESVGYPCFSYGASVAHC